ncbi:MAG: dTMP kinase [Bacteroidetes bacterium]|nr:MAG: dTMP kinase [Bacteroidota bacterium]
MLITFEGIDGSGKSTQARRLVERLERAGYPVLPVREPGGTALSEAVRRLLLDPALPVDPMAELLLFSAARAQLVAERIRPALDAGHLVVCDRFYDSTTAYQGGGRRLADLDWLHAFNRRVTGGLVPDRTYYIAVSPAVARARRAGRMDAPPPGGDRMEEAGEAFYDRVVDAYEQLARAEPDRILRLDGGQAPGTLHQRIWADLEALLARRYGTLTPGRG